ncbi:MAG: hypothetical protein ABN482_06650 [Corticimicrobacter sp.]|uniref:hypothetical protein n=1 Tax=Corticimicrobacter sp. TaxID=2678536 RepID=UPI0032DACFEE
MNATPPDTIIVQDIAAEKIRIRVEGQCLLSEMKHLGFRAENDCMVRITHDQAEKIQILATLAKMDALFLFGYGWYPSEVMALYREQGLYCGSYKVISWSSPDCYRIDIEQP